MDAKIKFGILALWSGERCALFTTWFIFRFDSIEGSGVLVFLYKLNASFFFIEFSNNVIWIWMKSCRKCNWIYLICWWFDREQKKISTKIVWWWICFAFLWACKRCLFYIRVWCVRITYIYSVPWQIDYRYIRLMIVYIVLYIHMSVEWDFRMNEITTIR